METFETQLDGESIKITITTFSDALLDGSNKVAISIYHPDTPRKWRKVSVDQIDTNKFEARITKDRLEERPVIRVRVNFIVDDIDLKEQIAKLTLVKYHLKDTTNDKVYESTYDGDFNMGRKDDETFNIVKKIKVVFDE